MNIKMAYHRLTNWEYWPAWIIYGPLLPVWIYYSIRSGSLFFFSTSNPTITNCGLAMVSKKEIYDLIPHLYIPRTLLIKPQQTSSEIEKAFNLIGLRYPCIIKPDIGMKSFGVRIANNLNEILTYAEEVKSDFLVQDFITYPNEIGIFYCRMPGEEKGRITGLVTKKYLSVVGDGKSTLLQLMKQVREDVFKFAD